jgi:acetoin utilization protein AcuB
MHQAIRHYMSENPRTVGPEETLLRARQLMQASGIRHLPVIGPQNRLVGIITERDIHLLEGYGRAPYELRVRDAMTPEPFVVSADAPVRLVARTMAEHKYGSAIVLDEGRVAGIFCATDALRALSELFDEYFAAPTSDRWGRPVEERVEP